MHPLLLAASKGRTACVELLLDAAPDSIEATDASGRTALMVAACAGATETVQLLAKRGAALIAEIGAHR